MIGLIDLYGPSFYPNKINTVEKRIDWGTKYFNDKMQNDRFKMFFAVHELEAWLLSQPDIFPANIQNSLKSESINPENVNFDNPPSKLLDSLYRNNMKKPYKKTVDGYNLFNKLDPEKVYSKCPNFKLMLDEVLKSIESAI